MRIEKTKTDDIKSFYGVLFEIRPRIIDHWIHTRVSVRPLRMSLLADLDHHWIDVDSGDTTKAAPDRSGDIIARPGPDDQCVIASGRQQERNLVRSGKLLHRRPIGSRHSRRLNVSP